MGFFSWKTQDTHRSICNKYTDRATFPVTMTDNKGNKWTENYYDGYGVFGGKDYYELLAEMNGYTKETIPKDIEGYGGKAELRNVGISLYFGDKPFIAPNLTEDEDWKWENRAPQDCEYQGYFYD